MSPAEKREYDAVVEKVRSETGDEVETLWAEGQKTPFEKAVAGALEWLAGIQGNESPSTILRIDPAEEN